MRDLETIKTSLLTSHDEGVDTATVYDELLTEISTTVGELEESKRQVEDLTNRVSELTANNLQLLDKIRYIEAQPEAEAEPEEKDPEVTIDNLFEEV